MRRFLCYYIFNAVEFKVEPYSERMNFKVMIMERELQRGNRNGLLRIWKDHQAWKEYPLTDAVLGMDYPVGVSNEFLGVESEVCVKEGVLLLVVEEVDGY